MTGLARVEQELGEAIGAVLTRHGMMPQHWTLLAEIAEVDEGDVRPAMMTFASLGITRWDSYGLLLTAINREKAEQIRAVLQEDD